jgi:hypothetical protein
MSDLTVGILINNAASIIGALAALVAAFKVVTLGAKADAAKVRDELNQEATDKTLEKATAIHAIVAHQPGVTIIEPPATPGGIQ